MLGSFWWKNIMLMQCSKRFHWTVAALKVKTICMKSPVIIIISCAVWCHAQQRLRFMFDFYKVMRHLTYRSLITIWFICEWGTCRRAKVNSQSEQPYSAAHYHGISFFMSYLTIKRLIKAPLFCFANPCQLFHGYRTILISMTARSDWCLPVTWFMT
jgi:hypothetical protein